MLSTGKDRGRVYRVVAANATAGAGNPSGARPALGSATDAQLVEALTHRNIWWRRTAQRLLVTNRRRDAVPALERLADRRPSAFARLHALWTLEGLGRLDAPRGLRADVISFSGASGAVLKSDSGTTLLPGCAAFELLQTLAPRLTGDHTVRALGAGLDPAAAAALGSFVGFLIERGLADDARASRGRTKPGAAHRLFAPELELLHRLVDQPFEQFERFRCADVLIVGQGVSFATCSAALIRGGLAVLRACPLDGDGDLAEARAMAEQSRAAGASASVEIVEAIEDLTPAAHQLAIYCSDAPMLARIVALNRVCCAQRRELLVGCMLDDVGVCGPLIESVSGGCWLCAVVRVVKDLPERARRAVYTLCERTSTSTSTATSNRALARIVGQDVAFEAFKILVGSRRLQTVNEAIVYASEPAVPCMLTRIPTTLSACLNYCAPVVA